MTYLELPVDIASQQCHSEEASYMRVSGMPLLKCSGMRQLGSAIYS